MKRVDDVVESEKYGYQNRADFILDAIRKRLRELGLLE
jgi:metal-responsive CopG/Arc/MetJ family transcriptional regulator